MSARTETVYFWLAVAGLFLFGAACGIIGSRLYAEPMPCHEDEAYVWTDAPDRAICIALDNMEVTPEQQRSLNR